MRLRFLVAERYGKKVKRSVVVPDEAEADKKVFAMKRLNERYDYEKYLEFELFDDNNIKIHNYNLKNMAKDVGTVIQKEPTCTLTNEELISRAKQWVFDLAESKGQKWILQIPVNFNRDPDILFMELCDRLEKITAPPATVIQPLGLKVLKECDEYLSQDTYEGGKPVHLNSIGAYSVLHQKIKQALIAPPPQPLGMQNIKEDIANIIRDNIYFAGQLGDYVIHGAIEKIIEYFKPQSLGMQDERFKMPNDKQIIGLAILFNDGKMDKNKLMDMVSLCTYVLDRLYENGDILIPSSKENQE